MESYVMSQQSDEMTCDGLSWIFMTIVYRNKVKRKFDDIFKDKYLLRKFQGLLLIDKNLTWSYHRINFKKGNIIDWSFTLYIVTLLLSKCFKQSSTERSFRYLNTI